MIKVLVQHHKYSEIDQKRCPAEQRKNNPFETFHSSLISFRLAVRKTAQSKEEELKYVKMCDVKMFIKDLDTYF